MPSLKCEKTTFDLIGSTAITRSGEVERRNKLDLPNFDSVFAGVDRIIQPDAPLSIGVINNLGVKSDFQNVGLGGARIGAAMSATGFIAKLENAIELDMAQQPTRIDSVPEFAALGPVPHGISAGAG